MHSTDRHKSIKDHWESPDTVSLQDENLRSLETEAILRRLPAGKRVLDVGCGDGINTLEYARDSSYVLGIDYSASMIAKAQDRLAMSEVKNVEFRHLPVQELDALPSDFDMVITQRCLINLAEFQEQCQVIEAIHRRLKAGGKYLMLECLAEGQEGLNKLRARFDLNPIPPAWHNCQFEHPALMSAIGELFELEEEVDFSLYFFITRVLNPLVGRHYTDPVAKEIDEAARKLEEGLHEPLLSGIGAQRLLVLRKL
jgi:ubiquinone/menaquinone biosynthesis C-methylase UbiE